MATEQSNEHALAQRRIGIPESRQLDLFAEMIERRGARVTRCPLVDIRDAPDATAIQRWMTDVIDNGLDEMIWLTGEGVRRLTAFAARHSEQQLSRFIDRLAQARAVTRGPKPTRELRSHGLRSNIAGTEPTTAGVIQALTDIDLAGHRIGVQLYGSDPNTPLMDFLADKQATTLPVAPYVYADEAEEPAVLAFIDQIIAGELDAVAFTSSPQVKRLLKVARAHARSDALIASMSTRQLCVAAVGPLVGQHLEQAGIAVTLMPEDNYFMKPLVRALSAHFERAGA